MSWGTPWLLLASAALPLLAILASLWAAARRRALAQTGCTRPELVDDRSPWRARLRSGLLWIGLALIALAAAGPRWGEEERLRAQRGLNIAVAIDCSNSMRSDDLYPDRIAAARRKALDLLRLGPGNRIAVLPFAGLATVRCPLTGDRAALEALLADCTPELFPDRYQGTDISGAVQRAIDLLGAEGDRARAILVLSDGDDEDQEAVAEAAGRARGEGIPIYGLLVADPEREVSLEIHGREVPMVPGSATMELLAADTGAITVTATDDETDITALLAHMERSIDALPWQERQRQVASERYQMVLLPGLVALALGLLLGTARRGRMA